MWRIAPGVVAEDSANRTHQRILGPPYGFEDRPGHQAELPSGTIVTGRCRVGVGAVKLGERFVRIPRSSNGRTAAFGAVNRGSNPCRGATTSLSNFGPSFVDRDPVLLTASGLAENDLGIPNILHVFAILAPVGPG